MPLGLVRKLFAKPEVQAMLKQSAKSTPMAVDVSADGMRKKSKALARGTGVTYSGVKTFDKQSKSLLNK